MAPLSPNLYSYAHYNMKQTGNKYSVRLDFRRHTFSLYHIDGVVELKIKEPIIKEVGIT